jgi:hypothetical protein
MPQKISTAHRDHLPTGKTAFKILHESEKVYKGLNHEQGPPMH